ncbi:MAG: quinoprotein dehydrogenase-associated SoxYZ-like carrier [Geminicoccaceae bacterium]
MCHLSRIFAAGLLCLAGSGAALANEDPLRSGMWDVMQDVIFDGEATVFDPNVRVIAPGFAEDNMNVPVTVDARALDGVEQLVLFADLNPIHEIARYEPIEAEPYLSLRVKMQQGGPIRAAARTSDGVWHVGGVFVDAAGGGCTAPATVHANADWPDHLGELWARSWPEGDGVQRVRMRVYHPMDTGLADGIPAFYIDDVTFTDADGDLLARFQPREPVGEHPIVTFMLKPSAGSEALHIEGRDTDANGFEGDVPLNWKTSSLDSQLH